VLRNAISVYMRERGGEDKFYIGFRLFFYSVKINLLEESRETIVASWMLSSKVEDVLEPLFAFFATDRPFAEVSRLAVVSRNWRAVFQKALKTATHLNLSRFAESLWDEDSRS
jgi:hypothetical protein